MIKYKYNTTYLKWLVPCVFLIPNLCFLNIGPQIVFAICLGITTNLLAVLSFVLLWIFPRTYYCFDEDGITYYSRKGELKWGVLWRDMNKFCSYWFGAELKCKIEYCKGDGKDRKKEIHISYRQYVKIFNKLNLEEKFDDYGTKRPT